MGDYRGVDADNPDVQIVHRRKSKRITAQERKQLKRRQAIEPVIGHLKSDHRMNRCHLKGELGDNLHAVLCAAGYNIKWLLRMIVKKGIAFLEAIFLRLQNAQAGQRSWWTLDTEASGGSRKVLLRLLRAIGGHARRPLPMRLAA